jgi:hypothetical protein
MYQQLKVGRKVYKYRMLHVIQESNSYGVISNYRRVDKKMITERL